MKLSAVWTDELDRQLARLLSGGEAGLDGGAELMVRHPDGEVAFRAPLARHHRVEATNVVWLRPVGGAYVPDPDQRAPAYAFDLGIARRRALEFASAHIDGEGIHLELVTGQSATVTPARHAALAELQRWDTYYYTVLDARTQAELDALAHDP